MVFVKNIIKALYNINKKMKKVIKMMKNILGKLN